MPRKPRRQSVSGIYHIILRGINKQSIFSDEEDNQKFLQVLSECKQISGFKLYAYCLMGNHVHLLMKEEQEPIRLIFKRIGTRYVFWFNSKYNRVGHLFQDRFRSEAVEDERYFWAVLRYIHTNPEKAGICATPEQYRWSSYNAYSKSDHITDTDFVLAQMTKEQFIECMNSQPDTNVYPNEAEKWTDEELIHALSDEYNVKPMMIQNKIKLERDFLLKEILSKYKVSLKQLSRITGISQNVMWKLGR